MTQLSNEFKEELRTSDEINKTSDKEVQAYHDFREILREARDVYDGHKEALDAIDYIEQRLEALLR